MFGEAELTGLTAVWHTNQNKLIHENEAQNLYKQIDQWSEPMTP